MPGVAFCDECGFDLSTADAASAAQPSLVISSAPAASSGAWMPSNPSSGASVNISGNEGNLLESDPFGDPFASSALPVPSVAVPIPVAPLPSVEVGHDLESNPHAPVAPKASLTIERNGTIGTSYPLDVSTLVGKWDMDAGIFPEIDTTKDDPDGYISRKHAQFAWTQGAWTVSDLGSTNGTALNRQKLTPHQTAVLKDNDEIIIGRLFLRFRTQ